MSQLPQTYGLAGAIQSTAGAVPVRNEKGMNKSNIVCCGS